LPRYNKLFSIICRKTICITPFLLVYLYYEYSRALVAGFNKSVTFGLLLSFEEKVFHEPLIVFFLSHKNILLDFISAVVYAMHPLYLALYALLLLILPQCKYEYAKFTLEFAIASVIGVTLYLVFPVAPPWIAVPGVTRIPNPLVMIVSALTGRQYYDPNPYAAMPSMHVGMTVLFVLSIRRTTGKGLFYRLALLFSLAMAFSVLYTGNHYLLDVIAGYLVGFSSVWLGRYVEGRYSGLLQRFSEYCGGISGA